MYLPYDFWEDTDGDVLTLTAFKEAAKTTALNNDVPTPLTDNSLASWGDVCSDRDTFCFDPTTGRIYGYIEPGTGDITINLFANDGTEESDACDITFSEVANTFD